jgi:carboxyl-terminal processing protease
LNRQVQQPVICGEESMRRYFVSGGLVWLAGLCLLAGTWSRADETPAAKVEASPADAVAKAKAAERYELLKLFADTLDQVERNYVEEIDRRELMEGAIRGMLSKLDPYSNYIPPAEIEKFKSSVENEFGGVGITVSLESGKLAVVSPVLNSPAYRAGLRGGDRIVEIEGKPTDGITLDDSVKKLKGKIGTSAKVTIEHALGGSRETVELARELIRVDSVLGDRRNLDDTWNFFLDEEQKLGYIRLSTFSRHTTEDMQTALRGLTQNGLRGLILDLRFNPGGLLTSAIEVADLLVAEGRIVSTAGRNAPERVWEAHQDGTFEGFPIVVLINRTSASASEIVAACLQDHGRAAIMGERSWGKGSVQNIVELEDGRSALKLTTAGYVRPSGKNIHRRPGALPDADWGVRPDAGLEVLLTADETDAYLADRRQRDAIVARSKEPAATVTAKPKYDKQLAAAVEHLLKQLKAPNSPVETADAK